MQLVTGKVGTYHILTVLTLDLHMNEYWIAIRDNDAKKLEDVLGESRELVDSSINSSPWKLEPSESYAHATKGIHVCSFSGRERLLDVLLKHSPDLEAMTFEENKGLTTPLVLAAWEGSLESCRLLLEAGANPNTWASAESPLYTAAEHHAWEKVELLTEYGARHDIFSACICGKLEIVEAEIRAYRPLLERRSIKRNRTPLEEATEHQQAQVVKLIEDFA